VGYEVDKHGDTHLLTFDPAKYVICALNSWPTDPFLSRIPQNLRHRALTIYNESTQVTTTAEKDAGRDLSPNLKRKRQENEANTQLPGKVFKALQNKKHNTSQEQDPAAVLKQFRIPGKALKYVTSVAQIALT